MPITLEKYPASLFKGKIKKIKSFLKDVAEREKKTLKKLVFVFCKDEQLLTINQQYLNHDTFTDIITFDYSEGNKISGEIYISLDRIKDNALKYKVTEREETIRVMTHGVLHLCGYGDKIATDKAKMRDKENHYLAYFEKSIRFK